MAGLVRGLTKGVRAAVSSVKSIVVGDEEEGDEEEEEEEEAENDDGAELRSAHLLPGSSEPAGQSVDFRRTRELWRAAQELLAMFPGSTISELPARIHDLGDRTRSIGVEVEKAEAYHAIAKQWMVVEDEIASIGAKLGEMPTEQVSEGEFDELEERVRLGLAQIGELREQLAARAQRRASRPVVEAGLEAEQERHQRLQSELRIFQAETQKRVRPEMAQLELEIAHRRVELAEVDSLAGGAGALAHRLGELRARWEATRPARAQGEVVTGALLRHLRGDRSGTQALAATFGWNAAEMVRQRSWFGQAFQSFRDQWASWLDGASRGDG